MILCSQVSWQRGRLLDSNAIRLHVKVEYRIPFIVNCLDKVFIFTCFNFVIIKSIHHSIIMKKGMQLLVLQRPQNFVCSSKSSGRFCDTPGVIFSVTPEIFSIQSALTVSQSTIHKIRNWLIESACTMKRKAMHNIQTSEGILPKATFRVND